MLEEIRKLKAQIESELKNTSAAEAEGLRIKYLSKKGVVTSLLKDLKDVSLEDKPRVGKEINDLKKWLKEGLDNLSPQTKKYTVKPIDITLRGKSVVRGCRNPIKLAIEEVVSIFDDLGFSVHLGPEVESDYYNFEALNVPKHHPARDMQDTFYLDNGKLLRTHTSPVQIHVMENQKPPICMIAPGAVYRRDNFDASHSPMFHQVEGLCVDKGITMAHLKGVLASFCHMLYGKNLEVRFRPSYFPFTEPSAEVDIACIFCKGKGCSVCKQSGWLEVLGCGMVHPNVFKHVGYDKYDVTGFAFGMGIERVAMLKYGIDDIRLYFENDLRFLEQFR